MPLISFVKPPTLSTFYSKFLKVLLTQLSTTKNFFFSTPSFLLGLNIKWFPTLALVLSCIVALHNYINLTCLSFAVCELDFHFVKYKQFHV